MGALAALVRGVLSGTRVGDAVEMGERVAIGRGSRLGAPCGLLVGDDVVIGKSCEIEADGVIGERSVISSRVRITGSGEVRLDGENWVGAGAKLIAPVTLGRGAVVAPGSVVTGEVPPMTIASGNPAAVIGARFTDDVLRSHADDSLVAPG